VFPRPIGRGPIEATRMRAYKCAGMVRFPRPIGRGPIEATLPHCQPPGLRSFPRPIGRVPIEAPFSS